MLQVTFALIPRSLKITARNAILVVIAFMAVARKMELVLMLRAFLELSVILH